VLASGEGKMTDKPKTHSEDSGDGVDLDLYAQRHPDSKTLDFLITILGFGLCFAWVIFCLSEPTVINDNHVFHWLFLAVGAGVALFVVFVAKKGRYNAEHMRVNLYRVTGVLLALSSVILPLTVFIHQELLVFLGFILGGAGAALLQILWGEQIAKHELKFMMIVSPAAAIVTALLVAPSLTDLSQGMNLFSYLVFPLVSFGLLLLKADKTDLSIQRLLSFGKPDDEEEDEEDLTLAKPIDSQTVKLTLSIVIFSLLCRMFDGLIYNYSDPFSFFGDSSIFALVIVGASFLLLVLLLKDKFNLTLTYRLSLPIMVAGFVAIALFSDTQAALSILLINIGYNFFDILIWVILVVIVVNRGMHPLRVFGLGVAFMFAGMALGYFVGDVINSLIVSGATQITVVAMLCTLSLVVVAFLVVPEGAITRALHVSHSDETDSDSDSGQEDAEGRAKEDAGDGEGNGGTSEHKTKFDANCELVAEAYGLTPREQEVLSLLAYGRTLSIIARDLTIATGTARSHMEKIYRKLGVHKQQELIDLVEGYDPE
jgi:DNA-binding CsgD family transcriptional regulator